MSFEKNPLIKKSPIKFNKEIVLNIFECKLKVEDFEKSRVSCEELLLCRVAPTFKNSILLKNACLNKWNKQIIYLKLDNIRNRNPIWDRVEKATIFLKSFSLNAKIPEIMIVANAIKCKTSKKKKTYIIFH
jgi:hypothetical protein